jgi:hypothetical protein
LLIVQHSLSQQFSQFSASQQYSQFSQFSTSGQFNRPQPAYPSKPFGSPPQQQFATNPFLKPPQQFPSQQSFGPQTNFNPQQNFNSPPNFEPSQFRPPPQNSRPQQSFIPQEQSNSQEQQIIPPPLCLAVQFVNQTKEGWNGNLILTAPKDLNGVHINVMFDDFVPAFAVRFQFYLNQILFC